MLKYVSNNYVLKDFPKGPSSILSVASHTKSWVICLIDTKQKYLTKHRSLEKCITNLHRRWEGVRDKWSAEGATKRRQDDLRLAMCQLVGARIRSTTRVA